MVADQDATWRIRVWRPPSNTKSRRTEISANFGNKCVCCGQVSVDGFLEKRIDVFGVLDAAHGNI